MTVQDNETRNIPVDLACRMDDHLRANSVSGENFELNGDRDSQPGSISELSENERQELKAAKAALYFLNRVRVDLDNLSHQHDSSIVLPANRHSTVKNLETLSEHSAESTDVKRLGRFKIVRAIGQGGFARVYLARDPQLDRDVAIKVLQAHALLSDESRERFVREARAAAVLSHPAILPIYETGNIGPVTFIVSEYCPGSTLAHWFSDLNAETDPRTAAEIVAQIAEAAQHAHQRGVIHRDLKPANVLIQDGDEPISQRLRVADFGLAKQLECDDMTITTEGAVLGTPAYMSPEQARGDANVDGATDIFSLGVILYELLTGTLPFKKSGHLSTLNAIANEIPVAPRKINSDIPKNLEAICLKCLNKRAEDRYAVAFSLADDLNAWLDGRQIAARHASRAERLVRWVRREPAIAAALALAFFSLIFGLALTGWQWQKAQVNLVNSNIQRDRALKNINRIQKTVESVLDDYSGSLNENLYLNPAHRRVITEMISLHQELIDDEAQTLRVNESTIESYVKIARLNRKLGQYERAQEICQQARTLTKLAIENNPGQEVSLRFALVDIRVQQICVALNLGRHELAEKLAREAEAEMKKFAPQPPTAKANYRWYLVFRHLALALHGQDKFAEMVPYMENSMKHSRELLESAPDKESYQSNHGVSLQDVATAYRAVGRRPESTTFFENALSHFQKLASQDSSTGDYRLRIGFLHMELADSYMVSNRLAEADAEFAASKTVLEELVADRPSDIGAYNRLVHAIIREARFRKKTQDYEKARALHERGMQMADNVSFQLMKLRYQMFFRVDHAALLINHFAQENDAWVNDPHIEELLDQAIEIGQAAVLEFPSEDSLVKQLAEAFRHKGRMLYIRGNVDEAYQLVSRAAEIALRQLRLAPERRNSQLLAISRVQYTSKLAAELEHFDEAKSILIELSSAAPNEVHVQFQTARFLSRLVGYHRRAGHASDEISEIESLALKRLTQAFDLGFVNEGQFKQQSEWKHIRNSDAFNRLVEAN